MRTSEALAEGIHPRTIYAMRDAGQVERLAPGLYRLADMPPMSSPDLAIAALGVPQGVVCLISALAYHGLTTQVPHKVDLALPRTARRPRLEYPPLRVYRFAREAYLAGIQTQKVDDTTIRVYCPEKTLADCVKYRNKVGLDVALEAIRMYRSRRGSRLQTVLEFARICRVEKVMRPYLEAVI